MLVFAAISLPALARAGFLSDLWKKIAGVGVEEVSASVSMPLLGSQAFPPSPGSDGIGGPQDAEDAVLPLPSTQESALIASRNPLGTLPSSRTGEILVYTVREGDTPGAIADHFGISLNTLLWANNIRNPHLIKVGDELVILPVSGVKYEIKKGDTVESIAKKFKGDVNEILSFNGLAIDEVLDPGTTIIIPDGEIAAPPSPVPSGKNNGLRFSSFPEYVGYYLRPILGGRKSRGIHGYNGVDLANSCGLPVLASADGAVIIARTTGWNGGYGKYIVLAHSNGTQTLYAHLSQIFVTAGQEMQQGMALGLIGSTGNSTGCHVHFEVRGARNPF